MIEHDFSIENNITDDEAMFSDGNCSVKKKKLSVLISAFIPSAT